MPGPYGAAATTTVAGRSPGARRPHNRKMRLAGPCALIQVKPAQKAAKRGQMRQATSGLRADLSRSTNSRVRRLPDDAPNVHRGMLQTSTQRCAAGGPLPQGTARARRSPGPALRQAGGDRRGSVRPVVEPWCDSGSEVRWPARRPVRRWEGGQHRMDGMSQTAAVLGAGFVRLHSMSVSFGI